MTRQELEQYPSLLKEIEYLKSKAKQVEKDHKAFLVADTVYGSTEAAVRYFNAEHLKIPIEWIEEYNEIIKRMEERK